MKMEAAEILRALGAGQPIHRVCADVGISRDDFDRWWQEQCRARVPAMSGEIRLPIRTTARIDRDRWGIPHISADDDASLFFALGFAAAQDRFFQLDYLRRRAGGRLAEVLGAEAVPSDVLYRTIDLAGIAATEATILPTETRELAQAYCDGINAWLKSGAPLPIEFDLLGYAPEPWRLEDSLAIEGEFRWYLTGRLPVIAIPEILKRHLQNQPLYHAALAVEAGDETILWTSDYAPAIDRRDRGPEGDGGMNDAGSNNWAVSGARSKTGKPLVAGDPHLPYFATSTWYEARLQGGSFNVAGVMLSGMPAIMVGRNRHVAWTITNNICSLRDLYQERTSDEHPNHFLYDGCWEPARERYETIRVKGGGDVLHVVRSSRNGPIVDHLLPAATQHMGPVSLRWVGQQPCGWLTALLGMDRAKSVAELCEASRPWVCPTFNVVSADAEGHIGLQTTGRIPIRPVWERGFRPGWDPRHQWSGLATFEEHPRVSDPERGFVVTANNRVAGDDYPVPLNCTATSGHRARRIRQEIERLERLSLQECQALQLDVLSLRAKECVPPMVAVLKDAPDERVRKAVEILAAWDFRADLKSVGPTIFNAFFTNWLRAVAEERFALPDRTAASATVATLVADRLGGLAVQLLSSDPMNWFHLRDRTTALCETLSATLDDLEKQLGPDISSWQWARVHKLLQPHYLSTRGDLGELFDISGVPTRGDGTTVCSSTPNASLAAYTGAGHRMVVDLADPHGGFWTMEAGSSSGHPGSPHYRDQLEPWNRGEYRYVSLDPELAQKDVVTTQHLHPGG